MSEKLKYILTNLLTFVLLATVLIFILQKASFTKITIDLKVEKSTTFQIFYVKEGKSLNEDMSVVRTIEESPDFKKYIFPIHDQNDMFMLRFDLGTKNNTIEIRQITISGFFTSVTFPAEMIRKFTSPNEFVYEQEIVDDVLINKVTGPDPYLLAGDCLALFQNRINKYWDKTTAIIMALILSLLIALLLARATSKKSASVVYNFDLLTTIVFILLIYMPLIVFLTPGIQKVGTFDNRTMTPFPKFKWNQAMDWPSEFGQYFEDRFGFRNDLIVANNKLKAKLFNMSAIPDRVRFGKDGWLFFTGENAAHNYILNDNPFSDTELEQIYKTLLQRHDWLQSMGIKYYIMIPPIKAHVYEEYLPESLKGASHISRLDQVINYLKGQKFPIEIIDLRKIFKEKKSDRLLYYKTDTHWNLYGAYYGYKELINTMQKDFPELRAREESEYEFVEGVKKHEGDLSQMLAIGEVEKRTDIFMHPLQANKAVKLELDATNKTPGQFHFLKIVAEIPDSVESESDLKIVVFRDSYTNYLHTKISEHFKRSVYIWTHRFDPEAILSEQPDIVAEITLERYIHEWAEGNPSSIQE